MSASDGPRVLSIVVPVYNERATFAALIERVLALDLKGAGKEVIIVEGNSTDGTRELVRACAGRPGVTVVYEERPRGKGAAVRAGLARATGDFLLIQDGDLEYDPADTPRLLAPLLAGTADVVFGSRVLDSPQHWQFRRLRGPERLFGFLVNLGGVLFTGLFNRLYGTRLSDGATMYKLFRTADLKALTLRSDGFDYDWELSAKLAKKGLRFAELPVFYRARSVAEGKKIRFWRDGWRVLAAILRYRFAD
ncbi:MAG: glycosyltransferase family 2 protein [Elusimicrobia bacterium]|nr:glycosyltransferase family 2 protein [Elusimicrobiota bacterium]